MSLWNKNLYEAIINKNIQDIEKYILKGADPNEVYCNKVPLGWAILTRDTDIVKILLDRGADPNVKIAFSPLIYSIQEGEYAISKYLVEMGANACQPCKGLKKAPLSYAISSKNIDLVEHLLDNGAEFTLPTGLMSAIDENSAEIVRLLLKRKVSVSFKDKDGFTPFLKAMEQDDVNLEVIEELLKKGANINEYAPNGDTPLLKAVDTWNKELLEKLIRNGADVNLCHQDGTYPIIKAIDKRNLENVKLLVRNGAKLNVRGEKGDTPFLKSVRTANFHLIKYLMEQEIDVNEKNKCNETALSIALSNFDFRTFDFLVKFGADLNLASQEIEEMINNNLDFAVYMAEKKEERDVKKLNLTSKGLNGHEEASSK